MKLKECKKYLPTSVAVILMFGVTGLFFAFPGRHLALEISPAILGYIGLTFIFVFINYFMTGASDPGTYPKRAEPEDDEDELRAPVYVTVLIHDISVHMKWCSTCNFYRPPRVSHCSICNNCIDKFDHHCPWVNNCIGRRNYHYFFCFLMILSLHMVNVFGFSLWVVILTKGLDEITAVFGVSMAILVIDGLLFIPVFGLFVFHITLVSRGRTTNEQVTGKFRSGVNPFDNGCAKNCYSAICPAQIPRYINRHDEVDYKKYSILPPYILADDDFSLQDASLHENGGERVVISPSSGQTSVSYHVKSNGSENSEAAVVSNVPEVRILPRNGSLRQELDPNRFRAKVTPVHTAQSCQPADALTYACMEVGDSTSESERQNFETVLEEESHSGGNSPRSDASSTAKLVKNSNSSCHGSQTSISEDQIGPRADITSPQVGKRDSPTRKHSENSDLNFGSNASSDMRSPLSNENNCNNSSPSGDFSIQSLSEVCESGYVSTYNSTEPPANKDMDLTNKIELENAMRDIAANVALLPGAESTENLKNGKIATSQKAKRQTKRYSPL